MSSDIEKLAVFDSRIVQQRPRYAVEKGALSVTNAPFNAIAATPSQHTYNIYVPSENVFVDRGVEWSSTVFMTFNAVAGAGGVAAGNTIVQAGRDFSLCAFPLNSLCSTMTATINDTTTVINSQDVLTTVLRLTDYKENRLQRTCPTMLDTFASYSDGVGTISTPIAGWENTLSKDQTPNGAFAGLVFTDPAGNALGTATPAYAGAAYNSVNGVPVAPVGGVAGGASVPIYIRWRTTEKLVLSPFTFADSHEWDTGLFGINNIQLIMNLQAPDRLIRSNSAYVSIPRASIAYNTTVSGGSVFQNSVVNVQFLTPSLDVPLPPKSVVPYMEFPRYISQPGTSIPAGQYGQLISQTITLPQIPDLFIIYAKPQASALASTDADYYFPVASADDGIRAPLSINFDNFSGLLSSVTAEQLYQMSVHNGLEMDWQQWLGYAHLGTGGTGPAAGSAATGLGSGRVPLTGGVLVLKPSQDITLQTGQAPSLVGNFTFQFQVQVKNNTAVPQTPQLYVITANSGFFESIRGSSRIIKGVLSEQDIISAPLAPTATRAQMGRWVGGAMKGLATVLSKAPTLSAAGSSGAGSTGAGSSGAGSSGAGASGAGSSGAGSSGAGSSGAGRRRGMSARLM